MSACVSIHSRAVVRVSGRSDELGAAAKWQRKDRVGGSALSAMH